ncbi:MAG: hypothetical protein AB7C98_01100 [Acidithiobacillus sp.]
MSDTTKILTNYTVAPSPLALCDPSDLDRINIEEACLATNWLLKDVARLYSTAHPVLSMIARDLVNRASEIASALHEISAAIADTSVDISAQDVEEWTAELRDEAVLTAMSHYDLRDKVKIFSQSMAAVRADRISPNVEQAAG